MRSQLATPSDTPVQESLTLLSESARTRVERHVDDQGATVIRKTSLAAQAHAWLRHEEQVLRRLDGIAGVSKVVAPGLVENTLTLRDFEGPTLASQLAREPAAPEQQLRIALALARTLAQVHQRGVVHKDISPDNIVMSQGGAAPVLIDFNTASTFSEERPAFTHESHLAGTIAYMPPEQTGRTGRAVDQRSDLYALGATCYEMATGRPPFTHGDALSIIHQHLASPPQAPGSANPDIPPALSAIIMRLLEKEPDRRYQSAEGLAHDLERALQQLQAGDRSSFELGQRDFPRRLSAPSRLIGRSQELKVLRETFEHALQGRGACLLVAGALGVGKSALIDELRPLVTARRGWFVTGKFDQYQQDASGGAAVQALRQLGRLLLAEPDEELAAIKARVLTEVGNNAAFIAAGMPEFSRILGHLDPVRGDDPVQTAHRVRQSAVDLIRAIVSAERPLVMVLDDLQRAPASTLELVDALHSDKQLPGFMLVGAYRPSEIDAAHPVTALLARWAQLASPVQQIKLDNLPPSSVAELLQEMLRLPRAEATRLAQAVGSRTSGNPYDTVELVNALRRAGTLALRDGGWHWDAAAIRQFTGQGEVLDIMAARIERLPRVTRQLMEIMACLGGETRLHTLCLAAELDLDDVQEQLRHALEEGLLLLSAHRGDPRETLVRFRHDRVQQAAYGRLDAGYRSLLHLSLARRLSPYPALHGAAAQQYMQAGDTVIDAPERREAAQLLRGAARQASLTTYALAERYQAAAMALLGGLSANEQADSGDAALWAELASGRHAALYGLGRLDEADALYADIVAHKPDDLVMASATQVQISSLVNRARTREALALGLGLLARMGLTPPDDLRPEIKHGMEALSTWAHRIHEHTPVPVAQLADARALAMANLLRSSQVAAFFCDQKMHSWLVLRSLDHWQRHGPSASLVASLCSTPLLLSTDLGHARASYEAARHIVRVGETYAYEPATSWARHIFVLTTAPWFEPIDICVSHSLKAREGLLQGGDLQGASFTFYLTTSLLLDCAPTLDRIAVEVESGLEFEARTGNNNITKSSLSCRQFLRAMNGQTAPLGSFESNDFDETGFARAFKGATLEASVYHQLRGLSAALFGDHASLIRHATAAMGMLQCIPSFYTQAHTHLLNGLARAEQLRTSPGTDGPEPQLLAQFDASLGWMKERARHAPANFLHLQYLLEAERAWSLGLALDAARAFEQAMAAVKTLARPWHHAYITERAALFHLRSGLRSSGELLMAEARDLYDAWGARGKVHHLTQSFAFLRKRGRPGAMANALGGQGTEHGAGTTDLIAALHACHLIGGETRLDRLGICVTRVLAELSGASKVLLMVRDDDDAWTLAPTGSVTEGISALGVEQAGTRGLMPMSVFRYVERLRERLLVPDAKRDDRFMHDTYFGAYSHCSLLIVPVMQHKQLRAVLMLENSLSHDAFSEDRLDIVGLLSKQVAVALGNALAYELLERKMNARAEALAEATRQLEELNITDALTSLPNRRRFIDVIDMEFKRALRSSSPIGLMVINLDQFKLYNDQQGHQAGDACLRRVAQLLKSGLRRGTDFIGRLGGKEFVVVLPGSDLPGTQLVAERLRECVASARSPHAHSSHGFVSVSIGCTAFIPDPARAWAEYLELADQALRLAKHEGRNRVAMRGFATNDPTASAHPALA